MKNSLRIFLCVFLSAGTPIAEMHAAESRQIKRLQGIIQEYEDELQYNQLFRSGQQWNQRNAQIKNSLREARAELAKAKGQ